MSRDGREWLFQFLSLCKKLDCDSRVQLHALRLKIHNFILLLSTSMPTPMHCDPRVKTLWSLCIAVEIVIPVRDFHRLRLPPAQDGSVISGLDDGLLDSLTPALAG